MAAVLLLWWLFALAANSQLILPQPWQVLQLTLQLLGSAQTWTNVGATLLRSLAAFALSSAFALGLALLSGVWLAAKPFVDGAVAFLRSLPTISVILLFMIVLNSSLVPVLVAFLVVFPVIYTAFSQTNNKETADLCKVYKVTAAKKVRYLLLPQIAQSYLAQCKDTLLTCIKIVVAGEVMALPRLGLGRDMYVAKVNLQTAQVMALTLLTLAICFVLYGLFALAGRCKKW